MINLYLGDCMEAMSNMPDKAYDLAIVDPPYGIGYSELVGKKRTEHGWKKRNSSQWDNETPKEEYWDELTRITGNQIICGGNYFELPPTRCFIIWDKVQRIDQADCEFIWTSFNGSARIFQYARGNESGFAPKLLDKNGVNIHPTQKPVALYKWLLKNYAKPGDKIIDTHGGSMSIAIACYDMGFDLDLWEIDPDYYASGVKRFEHHKRQTKLFTPQEMY